MVSLHPSHRKAEEEVILVFSQCVALPAMMMRLLFPLFKHSSFLRLFPVSVFITTRRTLSFILCSDWLTSLCMITSWLTADSSTRFCYEVNWTGVEGFMDKTYTLNSVNSHIHHVLHLFIFRWKKSMLQLLWMAGARLCISFSTVHFTPFSMTACH